MEAIQWSLSRGERIIFADNHNTKTSSHRSWTPGVLRISAIDAGQQIAELRGRDRHGSVRRARPQETAPFQSFRKQACALAVMPNHLQEIAPAAPKAE